MELALVEYDRLEASEGVELRGACMETVSHPQGSRGACAIKRNGTGRRGRIPSIIDRTQL